MDLESQILNCRRRLFWIGDSREDANDGNEKVVVIDKYSHIGGNCYSEVEPETGIEFHKYGTHIFHTSKEKVWKYIQGFTSFNGYRHQVLSSYKGKVYQMPLTWKQSILFMG